MSVPAGQETRQLLLELAALVREGERLRALGAREDVLEAKRLETDRLRWRLAGAVRRAARPDRPRAA